MKILVMSHHLPPNYRSGAELYAWRQSGWLQNQGHNVRVVTVEDIEAAVPRLESRAEEYQGVRVDRLYFNRLNYPNPLEASYNNPEVAAWLKAYLADFEPDLLLVNACYLLGMGILEAARQAGIPVVLTLHDFWFLCQRLILMQPDGTICDGRVTPSDCALCLAKDQRRYRWADKLTGGLAGQALVAGSNKGWQPFQWLLGGSAKIETLEGRRRILMEALLQVERIIAPSRFLKQVFVQNGFPAEKIDYYRYGLDTERLTRLGQARAALAAQDSRRPAAGRSLRIGYLGQILPHKGVDVLVEAFRRVDQKVSGAAEASLVIYGALGRDPTYDARLKRLAGTDPRITFAGGYAADQLLAILLGLDVVVVPSIWLENSPLVIMEAQAAGLPVIATNLGGMAEMVRHEQNGLLFKRKDAPDLAQQLERLLTEPGLLAKLSAGVDPVKSLDQEFADLEPIYRQVVAEAQAKRLLLIGSDDDHARDVDWNGI
jgi:glycosyltransferase involved in cell wall biosynthesis